MLMETGVQKTKDNKAVTWYNFISSIFEISVPDLLWNYNLPFGWKR
jgi:hypothetical protein